VALNTRQQDCLFNELFSFDLKKIKEKQNKKPTTAYRAQKDSFTIIKK